MTAAGARARAARWVRSGAAAARDFAAPRWRGWARWALRGAAAFAVLLVVLRLLLPVLLPGILSRVGRGLGLAVGYDDLDLSVLAGEVELTNLTVAPLEGGPPIASVAYVHADVAVTSLLSGRPRIERLIADGVTLDVVREQDGRFAILRRIAERRSPKAPAAPPPPPEPEPDSEPDAPPDPDAPPPAPPIAIDSLALTHIRVRFRDASVEPSLDARLEVDVRVADLANGAPRPAHVLVRLSAPPVLGAVRLEATGRTEERAATVEWTAALERLNLAPLAGYLRPLGLQPVARDISGGLSGNARAAPSARAAGALDGSLALSGLRLAADGRDAAVLDRFAVDFAGLSPHGVEIGRVEMDGLRASAERRAVGDLVVAGVAVAAAAPPAGGGGPPGPERGPELVGVPPENTLRNPKQAEPRSPTRPFRFALGAFVAHDFRLSLHDLCIAPPTELALALEEMSVRDVVADPARPDATARIDARVGAPGIAETILVSATARPFGPALALDLALTVEGIAPRALAPYLAAAGAAPTFERGRFGLRLGARATRGGGSLRADLDVTDVALADGATEHVAVDRVRVAGLAIAPNASAIELAALEVVNPRIAARRDASGAVHALGLRIATDRAAPPRPPPAPASASVPAPEPDPATTTAAVAPPPTARPLPSIAIRRIALTGAAARFTDEAIPGGARLAIEGAGIEILDLVPDLRLPSAEPAARAPAPARLRAWLHAPGIVERVEVTGELSASLATPGLELTVQASGLSARAAAPYLAAAGIAPELEDGSAELRLAARMRREPGGAAGAEVTVETVRLADGENELFALGGFRIAGVRVEPRLAAPERIAIDEIALARLKTGATLSAGGAVRALGFKIGRPPPPAPGPAPRPAPSPAPVTVTAAPASVPPPWPERPRPARAGPRIELRSLHVDAIAIDLRDETRPEAIEAPVRIAAALGPLSVDASGRRPLEDAPFRVTLALPGIVETIEVAGAVAAGPGGARLRARASAERVSAAALRPALAPFGAAPAFVGGAFAGTFTADVRLEGSTVTADAAIEGVALRDGEEELLGLDALRVRGARAGPGGVSVEAVEIERPRIVARREPDGKVVALGLRLGAPPPAPPPPPAPELTPAPALAPAPAPAAAPAPPRPPSRRGPAFALGRFAISDARATFTDLAVTPTANLDLAASLEIAGIRVGRGAPPATLRASLGLAGALDRLSIDGTLVPDPQAPSLALRADATGLRAGPLAAYLPPGKTITLADGRLGARLEAGIAPAEAGGRSARLVVSDVELRDGAEGPPLLHVDAVRLVAPRLDPAAGTIEIDELKVLGIETRAEKTPEGIRALGVAIGPAPAGKPAVSPIAPAPASPPPAPPPPAPAPPPRRAPELPLVTLRSLELGVRQATVHDRTVAGAEPIVISGLRFGNASEIRVLGPSPMTNPPVDLFFEAAVAPLVRTVTAAVRLSPFAPDPDFGFSLEAAGISGEGLLRLRPDLAARIDGRGLADGRFRAALSVLLRAGGRGLLEADLARGFGAEVAIRGVEFRAAPAGPVLLGVSEVALDVEKVDPASGGVAVTSLDIARPALRVTRLKDGIEALGLVVKLPAPPTPTAAAATPPAPPPADAPPAPPADAPPAAGAPPPPLPEIRIGRLTVNEADIVIGDRSGDPPMIVPIEGLAVNVTGLTTRALVERSPIRFDVSVSSGRVPLPKRSTIIPIAGLGGAIDAIAEVAGRSQELEDRKAFADMTLKGELSIAPRPFGVATLDLAGFELASLAGPAKAQGVDLRAGVMDVGATVRFGDDGSVELDSTTTIADLDISESPFGPVARVLKLPAPLNAVVFALRDDDGAIKVPLDVHIQSGGLGGGAMAAAASKVFLGIVARSLASVPLRALGTIGDAVGLVPGASHIPFFGEPDETTPAPIEIRFAVADAGLPPSALDQIDAAAHQLADDGTLVLTYLHDVGAGDLERTRTAATPVVDDRRDAIARIAARRDALIGRRADVVAEARAAGSLGLADMSRDAVERIRAMEAELDRLAISLDGLYALEREGAEMQQAERRARAACEEIGRRRLDAVEAALGPDVDPERVRRVRPRVGEKLAPGGGRVVIAFARKKK